MQQNNAAITINQLSLMINT